MDEYEFKIHVVKKGDSYSKLCNGDPKCLKIIQKKNSYSAKAIPIGAKIKVPVKKVKKEKTVAGKIKEVQKKEKPKIIETTKCCCKVAPWKIMEYDKNLKKRAYELKITKLEDAEKNKKLLLEDKNNVKEKQYELHIVAEEYKDGKSQDKKIVVEHEFFMKKCPLTMSVLTKSKALNLEDGSFKIDSNGNVKNAFFTMEIPTPNEKSVIEDDSKMVYIDGLENTTEGAWRDKSIFIDDNLKEVPKDEELSELDIIIKSIFNPRDIAKEIRIHPTGDDSCKTQETAHLYVSPVTKITATIRVNYTTEKKQPVSQSNYAKPKKLSHRKFEVTKGKWELSGNIKGNYGNKKLNIGTSVSGGGDKYTRDYTPEERKRVQQMEKKLGRNKGHLLGKVEKIMNFFKEADSSNKTYSDNLKDNKKDDRIKIVNESNTAKKAILKERYQKDIKGVQGEALKKLQKEYREKQNNLEKDYNKAIKRAGEECKESFPVFSFDPGSTGFMLGITDYVLEENDDDYKIDNSYNVMLKINILSGAELKVDLISLLISRTGDKVQKILSEVRLDACRGYSSGSLSAKVEPIVELTVSGGGVLEFKIKKLKGNPKDIKGTLLEDLKEEKKLPKSGSGAIKIGFKAKASLKAEVKVFFVVIEGEASAIVASSKNQAVPSGWTFKLGYFYDEKKKDGCWKWGAPFSGLSLYYVFSGSAAIKQEEDNIEKQQSMGVPQELAISGEWSGAYTIWKATDEKDALSECLNMPNFLT